jgi:hypothetical protein
MVAIEGWSQSGKVPELLRIVGAVQPIVSVAAHVELSLLEDNLALPGYLNHPVVELVADQGIAIAQANSPGWCWTGIASSLQVGHILPHDRVVRIDLHRAVVVRVRDERVAIIQPARKCRTIDRPSSGELLDDVPVRFNLNDAIVALVCDQDAPFFSSSALFGLLS